MNEIERIDDQMRRMIEGSAWHGPAILELLSRTTHQEAATRLSPEIHCIWEIVLHLTSWQRIVNERLQGKIRKVPDEEDWPALHDTSETAWLNALNDLKSTYTNLRATASHLSTGELDKIIGESSSTVYSNLHGTVQHNAYHGGQIALLQKMMSPLTG